MTSLLRNTSCKSQPQQNYESKRYLNKSKNINERSVFEGYWSELIGRFGTKIEYYTYNYNISTQDFLYGEDPVASFNTPVNIVMYANIASEAVLLSKFGIQTDADVTLLVSMRDYARVFGQNVEPKSGDVICLTELGWDVNEVPGYGSETASLSNNIFRDICYYKGTNPATIVYPPTSNTEGENIAGNNRWIRSPQLFEITDRAHQDMTLNTNTLLGHYVWVLKAKRFEYSYQPGIDPEKNMDDVTDETRTGLLSGYTQPQSPDKTYPGNIDDESETIWQYTGEDTPYGDY